MQADLNELKNVIRSLPVADCRSLHNWFIERDWQAWDGQIETDFESGKFDVLVRQGIQEKGAGAPRVL